jgi:hypothetical protein
MAKMNDGEGVMEKERGKEKSWYIYLLIIGREGYCCEMGRDKKKKKKNEGKKWRKTTR